MELDKMMEWAFGRAKTIVESGTEALRMIIAVNDKNEVRIIGAPKESEEAERRLVDTLRVAFIAWRVHQYVVVSEAWVSVRKTEEGPMPSDDPDRRDTLMVIGVDQEKSRLGLAEIKRNPDSVGRLDIVASNAKVGGRLANLMLPKGIKPPDYEDVDALADLMDKMLDMSKETLH